MADMGFVDIRSDRAGDGASSAGAVVTLPALHAHADAARPSDVVPFVALDRQHAALAVEAHEALARVMERGSFILGEEVELFESEFAACCSARHCVGVASGTAALTIALMAAGIGPGDEVIVPAHTFVASALAVEHTGASVMFCDVEPGTGLIDLASAAAVVGPRTAAILPVHLYGQPCDMRGVRGLAERHGLLVIEDAAQAHGARDRGRPVGSLGDAACFSFYPSKNLGALGDGGAICTDDDTLAGKARMLRDLGQRRKGEHEQAGFNERLDGLQAALLRLKLGRLAAGNEARRRHAARYRERLAEELLLVERPQAECVYHLFPILVEDRDGTAAALARAGIQTGVHYPRAACDHPLWRGRLELRTEPEAARRWAARELSLPMFPELTDAEVERVLSACAALGLTERMDGADGLR